MEGSKKLADSVDTENKKKYLFLRQTEMLEGFLKNGAISRAQYDTSYLGLIEKMNVTDTELSDWIGKKAESKEISDEN